MLRFGDWDIKVENLTRGKTKEYLNMNNLIILDEYVEDDDVQEIWQTMEDYEEAFCRIN